ncbi:hypothetical protein ACB092_01G129100 [Castanea dentata]
MALVLSRSLTTASIASLPSSSSFLLRNSNRNRVLNLTTAFVPQNGLKKRFSSSGLKWKYERRNHRFALQCEVAAMAKKEAADTSDEKFEYQAEAMDTAKKLYSHAPKDDVKKLEKEVSSKLVGVNICSKLRTFCRHQKNLVINGISCMLKRTRL